VCEGLLVGLGFGRSVGLLGGSVGLLGGLVGGLFVDRTGVLNDVPGDRVAVLVGRIRLEKVAVGVAVLVTVGVSSGFTGKRGISAI